MDIILDTNAINKDHFLKGAHLDKLCIAAKNGDHTVLIPEVVVLEMAKHYTEEIEEIYKNIDKATKDMGRISSLVGKNPFTKEQINKQINGYKRLFRGRLKNLEIKIIPCPPDSIKIIAEKAVKLLKPFKNTGQGCPDALIWASVIERMKIYDDELQISNPRIIFVSNNHQDFCASKKFDLHPDLIADIEDIGLEKEIIKIVPSLNDAFEIIKTPSDKKLKRDYIQFVTGAKFDKTDLFDSVVKEIMTFLPYKSFDSDEVGLGEAYESPTIDMFEEDFKFELDSLEILGDNEVLIKWDVSVTCLLDVYIPKFQVPYFEDDPPAIYDYDWNSHYVAAQKEKLLWFTVEVVADEKFKTLRSFEMEINEDKNNEPFLGFRSNDL